jgi:tetratricopeptide (TPR) repeat protein
MQQSSETLARDLLRLDDIDGARLVAEKEIRAAVEQDNHHKLRTYRLILLEVQRLRGHTQQALNELDRLEASDPPDEDDAESRIGISKLRGYYFGLLGKYQFSHQLLQQAEVMARDAGMTELLAEVHLCQAMIFYLQQNYSSSSHIFRLVLALSQQIGGWYFEGTALWGIGKNLMIETHYEEAITWLQNALAIFDAVGAKLSVAVAWSELSVCYLGLGNDGLALDLLRKAASIQHEAGNIANYQVALANIGNVYFYRGDHLTAITYFRRALALAREIADPVSITKWTYNINLAYLRLRRTIDGVLRTAC